MGKRRSITGYLKSLSREQWFAAGFVLVLAFITRMPNEQFFASHRIAVSDQALYLYFGHLVNLGQVPYVDFFDHKGPLVYLLYALGTGLNEKWGIWIVNYVFMAGILGFSYALTRKIAGKLWAFILTLAVYSCTWTVLFHGASPEYFCEFFNAVILYLLSDYYLKGELSNKKLLWIGVCCAFIFWLKHSTLITVLVLFFLILIDCIRKKRLALLKRAILLIAGGFAAVSLVVCVGLLIKHAGMEMLREYILFNFLYAGDAAGLYERLLSLLFLSEKSCVLIAFGAVALHILLRLSGRAKAGWEGTAIMHGLIALIVSLIVLSLPGREYSHYLNSLFPLCLALTAAATEEITRQGFEHYRPVAAVCILAVFCGIVYPNFRYSKEICQAFWQEDAQESQLTADILRYSKKEDTIVVSGFDSYGQYQASGRESATSWVYVSETLRNNIPGMLEDYRSQIQNAKPAVLLCHLDLDPVTWYGEEILAGYILVDQTDQYRVYARADKVTAASSEA